MVDFDCSLIDTEQPLEPWELQNTGYVDGLFLRNSRNWLFKKFHNYVLILLIMLKRKSLTCNLLNQIKTFNFGVSLQW